jgi:hypothetical protein
MPPNLHGECHGIWSFFFAFDLKCVSLRRTDRALANTRVGRLNLLKSWFFRTTKKGNCTSQIAFIPTPRFASSVNDSNIPLLLNRLMNFTTANSFQNVLILIGFLGAIDHYDIDGTLLRI